MNILHFANSAADCQWNKDLTRDRSHHIDQDSSSIGTGRDIEKSQLIGLLLIIAFRDFHRIPGIPYIHKLDPLYYPSGIDIQAGNNALGEPHRSVRRRPSRGQLIGFPEM